MEAPYRTANAPRVVLNRAGSWKWPDKPASHRHTVNHRDGADGWPSSALSHSLRRKGTLTGSDWWLYCGRLDGKGTAVTDRRQVRVFQEQMMRIFFHYLIIFIVGSLVADRAGAWSRIHHSVTGELGVGEIMYDGSSRVGPMIRYQGGVLTAFANCGGGQPACIHWSEDGKALGAGPRVYQGTSPVTGMVAYKNGVLTAFANCGGGQPACIHWSEDGKALGAGPRVYQGTSPVTAMVAYKNGVLTAFANCGAPNPQRACIHWSDDGNGLGSGPRVYAGSSAVASIVPIGDGILTGFNGLPDPPAPGTCPGREANSPDSSSSVESCRSRNEECPFWHSGESCRQPLPYVRATKAVMIHTQCVGQRTLTGSCGAPRKSSKGLHINRLWPNQPVAPTLIGLLADSGWHRYIALSERAGWG